jgi:zinc/manganese transport system substrate-binding protein
LNKLIIIILSLVMLWTIAGCNSNAISNSGTKSIVVTYSVLGAIVKDLAGDRGQVTVLVPNGLDPHDWEPSARDIETVNKAALIVRNGLGLEGGLEKTLDAATKKGVKTFVAADHIQIRHVAAGEGIPDDDPDQAIGAPDPHLWMDPLTMKDVISELAAEMQKDFGWDLNSRAADLNTQLDQINQTVEKLLSPLPESQRNLVTGHESMGYFANRYHFKLVGVIVPSLSSSADVTAADLAELKKVVQTYKVKAIFTELGTSSATAVKIAQETGVKAVELNTHALPEDGKYGTFMQNLAEVIVGGLQ